MNTRISGIGGGDVARGKEMGGSVKTRTIRTAERRKRGSEQGELPNQTMPPKCPPKGDPCDETPAN